MAVKKKAKPSTNAVLSAIRDAGKSLSVSELASELLTAFGGPHEFATQFRAEYDEAKPGSVAKSKMLECVTRMIAQASARNRDALEDMSQFSDADLQKIFFQLVNGKAEGEETPAATNGPKKAKP